MRPRHRPQVCRSLCYQFADACNTSESVLARCADSLLYDDPPCTDYAAILPADLSERGVVFSGLEIMGLPMDGLVDASTFESHAAFVATSPTMLYRTAAGVPIFFALVVICLHALCCVAQSACGGGSDEQPDSGRARDAMRGIFDVAAEGAKQPLYSQ